MVPCSCALPLPDFICPFWIPFQSRPLGSFWKSRHWLIPVRLGEEMRSAAITAGVYPHNDAAVEDLDFGKNLERRHFTEPSDEGG